MTRVLATLLVDTLRLGAADSPDLAKRWRRTDLSRLPALLAHEGGAMWLFRRLRAAGALDTIAPDIGAVLRRHAFEEAAHGMRVQEEAASVLRVLSGAEIPVILIKGVARRALAQRYPYLDARATLDVDLLLPADRIHRAHALLREAGYELAAGACEPGYHLPEIWGERKIPIELHSSTSLSVTPEEAWDRANRGAVDVEWGDVLVRVPSPGELAWNAVAHALRTSVARGFRLQHYLELAAIVAAGGAVEWTVMEERAERGEIYHDETREPIPIHIMHAWIDAALTFVDASGRNGERRSFDPRELVEWRLRVLGARVRLGRALTERMLEEGPRVIFGLPVDSSPATARWYQRLRRSAAGRASRIAYHTWAATRER